MSIDRQSNAPIKAEVVELPKENGFGLAGFIISLAGIVLCGIPSVVGIALSLIGMRKHPKGFAIAGLVLGLVGLLEIVVAGAVFYGSYFVAQRAGGFLKALPAQAQLYDEAQSIMEEWNSLGRIPSQSEGDELLKGKRDPMGNQFVYETDGTSFTIRTAGADSTLQTADDLTAGPFSDPKDLTSGFEFEGEDGELSPDLIDDWFQEMEQKSKQ